KGIVEESERPISELNLLSETEREQIVVEWNETSRPYPQDRCIHELFEEQVERTPERVALIHGDRQLSYGELNRRANQLAHYLARLGVGAETRVGICVNRGLEMAVGLLGALKAGGAYVPLDPMYPGERMGWVMEDGEIKVLLTEKELLEAPPRGK